MKWMILVLLIGTASADDCVEIDQGVESCQSTHSGEVVTKYTRIKMQWGWFIPSEGITIDVKDVNHPFAHQREDGKAT